MKCSPLLRAKCTLLWSPHLVTTPCHRGGAGRRRLVVVDLVGPLALIEGGAGVRPGGDRTVDRRRSDGVPLLVTFGAPAHLLVGGTVMMVGVDAMAVMSGRVVVMLVMVGAVVVTLVMVAMTAIVATFVMLAMVVIAGIFGIVAIVTAEIAEIAGKCAMVVMTGTAEMVGVTAATVVTVVMPGVAWVLGVARTMSTRTF